MKKIRLLIISALFSFSVTSQAAVLASASVYGGTTQNHVVCYLFNAGNASIGISAVQVFAFGNSFPLPLTGGNGCGLTLAPGATCAWAVNPISNGLTYSCRAVTSTTSGLRGTLDIRSTGEINLERADLR